MSDETIKQGKEKVLVKTKEGSRSNDIVVLGVDRR